MPADKSSVLPAIQLEGPQVANHIPVFTRAEVALWCSHAQDRDPVIPFVQHYPEPNTVPGHEPPVARVAVR